MFARTFQTLAGAASITIPAVAWIGARLSICPRDAKDAGSCGLQAARTSSSSHGDRRSRVDATARVLLTPGPRYPGTSCAGIQTPSGGCAGLPEHVDRDAAARIPVGADAQPDRVETLDQRARDLHAASLVEGTVVAKAGEIQLQRLAFHDPVAGYVVDHQMGEVRLGGDRTERGEFRGSEAHHVLLARMRRRDPLPAPPVPGSQAACCDARAGSGHRETDRSRGKAPGWIGDTHIRAAPPAIHGRAQGGQHVKRIAVEQHGVGRRLLEPDLDAAQQVAVRMQERAELGHHQARHQLGGWVARRQHDPPRAAPARAPGTSRAADRPRRVAGRGRDDRRSSGGQVALARANGRIMLAPPSRRCGAVARSRTVTVSLWPCGSAQDSEPPLIKRWPIEKRRLNTRAGDAASIMRRWPRSVPSPGAAGRRPGSGRSHSPRDAALCGRRGSSYASRDAAARPAERHRGFRKVARSAALSRHISGVCSTKRWSMPRLRATCSALMVSSRQSG